MNSTLHIINGDAAGDLLAKSGLAGEILVWSDLLYDGPRIPGWPDEKSLDARAGFLSALTGGGMEKRTILNSLENQYQKLKQAAEYMHIILWFDACLFDQSMLAHILTCLHLQSIHKAELICVDAFPGIEPFNGLGQLQPLQLAGLMDQRQPVSADQFRYAEAVDAAFARQDQNRLHLLSQQTKAPLPWVPAAVTRWLQEQPDPATGLGRLESLALKAIRGGCETPGDIFTAVAKADTPPQYWGDITLWAKINGLADRTPALVRITGPQNRLPQWESPFHLSQFKIDPLSIR